MVDMIIWVGRAVCVALIAAATIALPLTDSATSLKRCDTTESVDRTDLFMIFNEQNIPTVGGGHRRRRSLCVVVEGSSSSQSSLTARPNRGAVRKFCYAQISSARLVLNRSGMTMASSLHTPR